MYTCGIYKITNLTNQKCYIGQSVRIEKRWKDHKREAFNPNSKQYEAPLYRAFRKYGVSSFDFEILEECSPGCLDEKEVQYISLYDSYSDGYNQDLGGKSARHPQKLPDNVVQLIIKDLRESTLTTSELAKKYNVSGVTIRDINRGDNCFNADESYPIRKKTYCKDGKRMRIKSTERDLSEQKKCIICGCDVFRTSISCKKCNSIARIKYPALFTQPLRQKKVNNPPSSIELAKMIHDSSISNVAKSFGVSFQAVVKWCKKYEMPHRYNEICEWYEQQISA